MAAWLPVVSPVGTPPRRWTSLPRLYHGKDEKTGGSRLVVLESPWDGQSPWVCSFQGTRPSTRDRDPPRRPLTPPRPMLTCAVLTHTGLGLVCKIKRTNDSMMLPRHRCHVTAHMTEWCNSCYRASHIFVEMDKRVPSDIKCKGGRKVNMFDSEEEEHGWTYTPWFQSLP
jgi:hypothetical protein